MSTTYNEMIVVERTSINTSTGECKFTANRVGHAWLKVTAHSAFEAASRCAKAHDLTLGVIHYGLHGYAAATATSNTATA